VLCISGVIEFRTQINKPVSEDIGLSGYLLETLLFDLITQCRQTQPPATCQIRQYGYCEALLRQ
jgi:hypothetical protein